MLPFDEGRQAYFSRIVPDNNPFEENDWKYEEWFKGWSYEEESDIDSVWDWSKSRFKSQTGD